LTSVVNACTLSQGKPWICGSNICRGRVIMQDQLKSFEEHLLRMDLVRPNQVPYIVGWLKHHASLGHPEEALFSDILASEAGRTGRFSRRSMP